MREIKFRGLRKDNGQWAYGNLLQELSNTFISATREDHFEIVADTTCQFTGFRDKNGVEIYEGDIVEDTFKCLCIIKFSHPFCQGFYIRQLIDSEGNKIDITDTDEICWYGMTCNSSKELKVIGSLYQNPELLKS